MATRFRDTISILARSLKDPALILLLITIFLIAFGIERIFSRLEADQAKKVATVIGSLLRDESTMSRSYLLAQSIEDMHAYGTIKCAKLSRVTDSTATFYDSTFKEDCPTHSLETVLLPGLDGNSWEFRLAPQTDFSFYLIKWGTIVLSAVFLIAIYAVARSAISKERSTRNLIEKKRAFLEELTEQVRHDVASPMSALNMIAARAPLDADTKTFLLEAVQRANGIFSSLRSVDGDSEIVDLHSEISKILREKLNADSNFPLTTIESSQYALRIPRIEFSRVISNLLTNSAEAGATTIGITFIRKPNSFEIAILDNGTPIPPEVIARLGERGNSLGKEKGSGLGLSHAYNFMKGVGGELRLANATGPKVLLSFPAEILSRLNKT